jgi:hypothetical protein
MTDVASPRAGPAVPVSDVIEVLVVTPPLGDLEPIPLLGHLADLPTGSTLFRT